jgi:hypothetical protein
MRFGDATGGELGVETAIGKEKACGNREKFTAERLKRGKEAVLATHLHGGVQEGGRRGREVREESKEGHGERFLRESRVSSRKSLPVLQRGHGDCAGSEGNS